jgi:hypothetical protein
MYFENVVKSRINRLSKWQLFKRFLYQIVAAFLLFYVQATRSGNYSSDSVEESLFRDYIRDDELQESELLGTQEMEGLES